MDEERKAINKNIESIGKLFENQRKAKNILNALDEIVKFLGNELLKGEQREKLNLLIKGINSTIK